MRKVMIAAAIGVFGLTACEDKETSAKDKNLEAQRSLMEKATAAQPVPEVNNFLTRKYIAEWMKRMDDPSKTFFTYLYSNTGQEVLYAVGTRPINICTLMTPPKKKWEGDFGEYADESLGPAPTLSGVYGSGNGGCDTYYYFEAQTDRLVHFGGNWKYITSDQPMQKPEAEPLGISVQEWREKKEGAN